MDCLQTKLKGVVNNNNLPFFNAIKVTVYPYATPANNNLRIKVSSAVRLRIIGSGSFTDSGGNVLNDPKNLTVQRTNSYSQVYFTRELEKYDIVVYDPLNIISFVTGSPDAGSCAIGVESNDLNQCLNVEDISAKNWTYSTINVEDFAVCTKLNTLHVGYWSDNSNEHISGSYNKMVEGMIANGRNSGTITGKCNHPGLATINGHSPAAGKQFTLTIISSTEYTAAIEDETCRYVKSGDDWVLQS